MRHSLSGGACALILAGIASSALTAPPPDFPRRQPGLWEIKASTVEMGGMGQTFQLCVGPDTDDLLAPDGDECAQKTYRRDGDRIVFEARCMVEGSMATVEGIFGGDFISRYSGEIRSAYVPPIDGIKGSTVKQEGRWLGP